MPTRPRNGGQFDFQDPAAMGGGFGFGDQPPGDEYANMGEGWAGTIGDPLGIPGAIGGETHPYAPDVDYQAIPEPDFPAPNRGEAEPPPYAPNPAYPGEDFGPFPWEQGDIPAPLPQSDVYPDLEIPRGPIDLPMPRREIPVPRDTPDIPAPGPGRGGPTPPQPDPQPEPDFRAALPANRQIMAGRQFERQPFAWEQPATLPPDIQTTHELPPLPDELGVPVISNIERGDQRDAFLDFAQYYDHTPEGLAELLAAAQAAGHDWSEVGNSGSIDFGGGNIVDVIQDYQGGGNDWQWLLEGGEPPPPDDTVDARVDDLPTDRKVTSTLTSTPTPTPPAPTGPPDPGPPAPPGTTGRAGGIPDPGTTIYPEMTDEERAMLTAGEIPGEGPEARAMADIPFMPPGFEDISRVPVGQDPFSQQTLSTLAHLMSTGGVADTPLASRGEATLNQLLQSGGRLPQLDARRDSQRAMELEGARSPLDALRRAQMAQGQAALASRGLLGQGPEIDFMERMEQGLAPQYTAAGQGIELAERAAEDKRLSEALSTSADLSQAQSRNLVDTLKASTERQRMLGDMAVQNLDQNMEWNEFLATYGLDRAKTIDLIQQGRLADLLPLLSQFMQGAGLAAAGYSVNKPKDVK